MIIGICDAGIDANFLGKASSFLGFHIWFKDDNRRDTRDNSEG